MLHEWIDGGGGGGGIGGHEEGSAGGWCVWGGRLEWVGESSSDDFGMCA